MDFGKVSVQELDQIDFRLPTDPAFNKSVLKGSPLKNRKIYIGCAKWGRTEWVGKIYPPKTKEKDFLEHYVQHYNSIELNATHYKVYDEAAIKKWADKAGKGIPFLSKNVPGCNPSWKPYRQRFYYFRIFAWHPGI